MRRALFIAFFTLFFFKAIGQSFDLLESRLSLEIAPLSLLDTYNGSSVKLGSEFKLKNNYAVYSELGTFLPRSFVNARWLRKNNGIIVKGELKRYRNKEKKTGGLYNSIELFYKYQSYGTSDTINISPVYPKDYAVYKNVYCATVKFGKLIVAQNGLLADFSIGIGVRFKTATSTLTAVENDNILGEGDNSTNILINRAGMFIYPNFSFGVKIGYRIK
jgi:hypothetical protein